MSILNDMVMETDLELGKKGRVIYLDIDAIIPNELNMFTTEDIELLAENIKEEGLLQPLIVYKENGKNKLHTGHRRFMALNNLVEKGINYSYFGKDITGKAPVIYTYNNDKDEIELKVSMIRSNSYRQLNNEEKNNLINTTLEYVNYLEENGKKPKGRTREIVAEITGISLNYIQTYLTEKNKVNNLVLEKEESKSLEQDKSTETKLKKFVKKLDKLSEEALKIEFEEVSFEEHELLKDAIEDLKNSLDKIIY
ncbi:MAG: ParB N-terminal domain-containing protein [Erysipelotrichaceae bacterium]|nr:ParB N-terminal domain-containing protein [Erysipelotrichaceae bacterium]